MSEQTPLFPGPRARDFRRARRDLMRHYLEQWEGLRIQDPNIRPRSGRATPTGLPELDDFLEVVSDTVRSSRFHLGKARTILLWHQAQEVERRRILELLAPALEELKDAGPRAREPLRRIVEAVTLEQELHRRVARAISVETAKRRRELAEQAEQAFQEHEGRCWEWVMYGPDEGVEELTEDACVRCREFVDPGTASA